MKVLPWILCVILIVFLFCKCNKERKNSDSTFSDTTMYYDTIRYDTLIPRDTLIVRYVIEKLQIIKDSTLIDSVKHDSLLKDSANVIIPISQNYYKEEDFEAWVSGYKASLDSIRIFQNNFYVKKIVKRKKWGIGLQVGYELSPSAHGLYMGIGISYNLFQW